MPTYQYKCSECANVFEAFQGINEKPVEKCPKCGGKTNRIISGGAGFLLKGSGFHATDYRSEKYKKAADADKKESISVGKSADTKTESPKTEIKK